MLQRLKSAALATVAAAGIFAAGDQTAMASSTQPAGINLGSTSFNDAFGVPAPNWIYEQYFQYFHYSAINDESGHAIGKPVFNNPGIDALVSLNQIVYVTPYKIAGETISATALLPLVNVSSHFDSPSLVNLQANGFGLGDLTFGPALQGPIIFKNGRPFFVQRFEFDTIAPTGSYNTHKDINQGAGFWSLNPHWAFTVLPVPGLEISARIHYLYNFKNSNPASSAPLPAGSSYQAGQAAWANFDASYTVAKGLDLGINGYYFQQFTEDKTDGVTQHGSETTNFSIGPGLVYAVNQSNYVFANAYLPVIEKNTTSGIHLVFRYIHVFE
jgi:hypothetical protein